MSGPNVRPDLAALIAAALGRPVAADERIAVATSGGPDSLALLSLADAAFPGRVTALTVDHRLRSEAAAEAASVATQCAARGLPHVTLVREGGDFTSNIQARARAARYALMGDWCAAHGYGLLLTAHHADDQAETLLMRLNRASGSYGLAAIRPARRLQPGVMLVRPLLAVRKADLAALAAADAWQQVDDPTNRDLRHDRTAIRALLAATPALDVTALAASAAHLAADAEALAWAADLAWAGRVQEADGRLLVDAGGLPAALVQRLLASAVETLAGRPARGSEIARLAARLGAGATGTLAGIVARPGTIWQLSVTRPPQTGGKKPQNAA
ncbi:tRNA lysidine(34) synthetase TilS [Sandarakinorhabdus limnophila]|uniref:tRNA lysidine(34) synthetase TilS n=1 Tax=Sandarakinorhabdus limnophila TaxID=210512 RepID=UPI0026EF9D62|nr:tRNA lysidine(34) synthetase TilS [Sandarakinorhabdus limnophila]MCM0031437.1 tRNA lysidine(34) synthetase TilS [Sandarakinorhabdus limnophila]